MATVTRPVLRTKRPRILCTSSRKEWVAATAHSSPSNGRGICGELFCPLQRFLRSSSPHLLSLSLPKYARPPFDRFLTYPPSASNTTRFASHKSAASRRHVQLAFPAVFIPPCLQVCGDRIRSQANLPVLSPARVDLLFLFTLVQSSSVLLTPLFLLFLSELHCATKS